MTLPRMLPRFVGALALLVAIAPLEVAGQRAGTGSCPIGDGSTIQIGVEGVVIDKDSDVPLPGAQVRLDYDDQAGLPALADVTTTADETGRFRFCGLEAFRTARLRATYGFIRGDEERVDLERREDIELEVDLGDSAFIVFTVAASDTGSPVEGATVDLSPLPVGGITNEQGRVTFRTIPPGDYELTIRHIAFAERTETIELAEEQFAELRVELRPAAIAVEPLEVQITGRDPWLLDNGFYERQLALGDDGWFGTWEDIESYTMVSTLFDFKRELSIRFARNQFVILNGRPMRRLGYTSTRELREIPYRRIRGIEAYSCSDAPDEIMMQLTFDVPIGDCNLIAIWTR